MAVQTNPGIGEAAANRRATESELRQVRVCCCPRFAWKRVLDPRNSTRNTSIRRSLQSRSGTTQPITGARRPWVVRQLLFDGFSSINDIWRQSARVQAAAARERGRSELIALDTTEAYVDIVRYTRLVALAQENVAAHLNILTNVEQHFRHGRAGEGDFQQTTERVDSSRAALWRNSVAAWTTRAPNIARS